MGESDLEKQISWRKRDAAAQLRVLVVSLDELVVSNAHVVSRNEKLDVALLQLEPYTGKLPDLIPISLGDSRAVRPGQWVISMGHPWGVAEAAASAIVVEGGSDLPESPGAEREWIAVHLALRPGYSGGPLVDHQGKLIGLMAGLEVGTADPYHVTKGFVAKAISADARESDTILV